MSERIVVSSYEELHNLLSKGAIVTIDVGGEEINIVRKGRLVNPKLELQHYGEYPMTVLNHLLGGYNMSVYVYQTPPYTEKSPITERLLELWVGKG